MNQTHYTIHGINGPVVKVTGGKGLAMIWSAWARRA